MYIDPFWAGVITVLVSEMGLLFLTAFLRYVFRHTSRQADDIDD